MPAHDLESSINLDEYSAAFFCRSLRLGSASGSSVPRFIDDEAQTRWGFSKRAGVREILNGGKIELGLSEIRESRKLTENFSTQHYSNIYSSLSNYLICLFFPIPQ